MVIVSLKPGFLARNVYLCAVYQPGLIGAPWRVVARDEAGGTHDGVTIDGNTPPYLKTSEAARAYLIQLAARGVDVNRIWATPDRLAPRAYLVPSRGASMGVALC